MESADQPKDSPATTALLARLVELASTHPDPKAMLERALAQVDAGPDDTQAVQRRKQWADTAAKRGEIL